MSDTALRTSGLTEDMAVMTPAALAAELQGQQDILVAGVRDALAGLGQIRPEDRTAEKLGIPEAQVERFGKLANAVQAGNAASVLAANLASAKPVREAANPPAKLAAMNTVLEKVAGWFPEPVRARITALLSPAPAPVPAADSNAEAAPEPPAPADGGGETVRARDENAPEVSGGGDTRRTVTLKFYLGAIQWAVTNGNVEAEITDAAKALFIDNDGIKTIGELEGLLDRSVADLKSLAQTATEHGKAMTWADVRAFFIGSAEKFLAMVSVLKTTLSAVHPVCALASTPGAKKAALKGGVERFLSEYPLLKGEELAGLLAKCAVQIEPLARAMGITESEVRGLIKEAATKTIPPAAPATHPAPTPALAEAAPEPTGPGLAPAPVVAAPVAPPAAAPAPAIDLEAERAFAAAEEAEVAELEGLFAKIAAGKTRIREDDADALQEWIDAARSPAPESGRAPREPHVKILLFFARAKALMKHHEREGAPDSVFPAYMEALLHPAIEPEDTSLILTELRNVKKGQPGSEKPAYHDIDILLALLEAAEEGPLGKPTERYRAAFSACWDLRFKKNLKLQEDYMALYVFGRFHQMYEDNENGLRGDPVGAAECYEKALRLLAAKPDSEWEAAIKKAQASMTSANA